LIKGQTEKNALYQWHHNQKKTKWRAILIATGSAPLDDAKV
jgi:hypothetical protein